MEKSIILSAVLANVIPRIEEYMRIVLWEFDELTGDDDSRMMFVMSRKRYNKSVCFFSPNRVGRTENLASGLRVW